MEEAKEKSEQSVRGKYSRKTMHEKFGRYEVPKFERKFRGYDSEEVDKYLNSLVDAYNKMQSENEELKKIAEEYKKLKDRIADIFIEEQLSGPADEADVEMEKIDRLVDEILIEKYSGNGYDENIDRIQP